ncbi:phasin family protein [Qipengyuania sp. JC766]|uniref:phasin family protein n=1 Tax=Qipengyuania sp. JC766 TaxID=3232139 RepID=UPI00345AA577
MATKAENTSKIDAAAEKAYADAAAKTSGKSEAKGDVSVAKIADAVESDKPAPKTASSGKSAPATKKAAPAKKAATRRAPAKAKAKTVQPNQENIKKENIMNKVQETAKEASSKMKEGVAGMQDRAKVVFAKGSEMAADMGKFTKGNVEASVEAGKIWANGVQNIAKTHFEDSKAALETVQADAKEFAAVKSPTEFVQLQGKIASRNFDAGVAQVSKTTEMWLKLANEAFAPLQGRMSVAMDKVRTAA